MKKEVIHTYIEVDLKQQLIKEAKEKGLNLSAYIRMILFERQT